MPARTIAAIPALAIALAATGCQTCAVCADGKETSSSSITTANAPSPEQAAAMDSLAQLEGTWEMEGPDGSAAEITFASSSNGSVVREVMFPGTPSEMTNLYHMDGDKLVCTHYCAAGNQPRMVASAMGEDAFDFRIESVSNLLDSHDHYMGGLKLVMVDENTLEEHWTSLDQDGNVAGEMVFVLKRKGSGS